MSLTTAAEARHDAAVLTRRARIALVARRARRTSRTRVCRHARTVRRTAARAHTHSLVGAKKLINIDCAGTAAPHVAPPRPPQFVVDVPERTVGAVVAHEHGSTTPAVAAETLSA